MLGPACGSFDHSPGIGNLVDPTGLTIQGEVALIIDRKIRLCCYPYPHAVFPPPPTCQTLWRLMVVSLEEPNGLLMKQDCHEKLLDVSSLLTKMWLTRLLLVK
jgi:hypothetical protein